MIIKTTIRLTYNNNFIETSALKDSSQAINAINAINPFDSSGNIRLTYNNTFNEMPSLTYSSQATAINPVTVTDNVSDDQLKNEGQQTFQDGTTSVYMHVDQTFDKVGLIKGYTRTINFPSAIFKPADPKNIKQIKVN